MLVGPILFELRLHLYRDIVVDVCDGNRTAMFPYISVTRYIQIIKLIKIYKFFACAGRVMGEKAYATSFALFVMHGCETEEKKDPRSYISGTTE